MTWLAIAKFFKYHGGELARALAVLAGVAAVAAGGVYLRGLISDRDKYQAAAVRFEAEALSAQKDLVSIVVENRKALVEREDKIEQLTIEKRTISEKLREAYAANPKTKALAEMCLPDSVIECLLK